MLPTTFYGNQKQPLNRYLAYLLPFQFSNLSSKLIPRLRSRKRFTRVRLEVEPEQITLPKTNMEGPKMMVWKRYRDPLKRVILGIYVRFLGCTTFYMIHHFQHTSNIQKMALWKDQFIRSTMVAIL